MPNKIKLWPDGKDEATLDLPSFLPYAPVAPAMIVIPGGGYGCVCTDTEGGPIAKRFEELGMRCFILNYRVAPSPPRAALEDAARAVKYVRANSERFRINPNMIAVCGFSAGGHLAASLGTISSSVCAKCGDGLDDASPVPNAMVLSYPVITGMEFCHFGSLKNWSSREPSDEDRDLFSLEKHVTKDTPPAFAWCTAEDAVVPCENTLLFFDAMRKASRPCEIHVFPHGGHGMQLGYGKRDIALWPEMAKRFLLETCGFTF